MFKNLLFIFALMSTLVNAQHSIKGTFSPAEDYNYAILYKITPTHTAYIADTRIDAEGNFEIQLDSTISQGVYRLVYALPQEEFNFDIIYNTKEDIVLSFNAETGVKYQSSKENNLLTSYTKSMYSVSKSISEFFRQKNTDSSVLNSYFENQRKTQKEFEKESEGSLALHFIKANNPYIPEKAVDLKSYLHNIKTHFFDHVDFNNKTLQSSNFLIERVLNYVIAIPSKNNDVATGYKNNIDAIYLAMKEADPKIKGVLLKVLWKQMADESFDEVANHITDQYLMEIAQSLNDRELIRELIEFKRISIGVKAPEFSFNIKNGNSNTAQSLYDLDTANKYAIVFWSSTCSHCLREIPLLHKYIKTLKKNQLQVIAFGLEDDDDQYQWKNQTYNYPEFIHVLGLGKWDNETGNNYNINETPTYFVLDKDKNIIAKPEDLEAFMAFIDEN